MSDGFVTPSGMRVAGDAMSHPARPRWLALQAGRSCRAIVMTHSTNVFTAAVARAWG